MFKRQNFCHIASNNRNNVKVGVFVYRTTDDVTTVTTSGYFNERIIDINLHDLIIHEQINIADTTIVERNVLCVIRRTADNVETKVIKSNWEVQIEQAIDNINQQLANLALSDLTDVTVSSPTVGQYLRWNGVEWINMDGDGGGGSGVWGAITGDINDQADLQTALSGKANVDLDNLSATGQAKFDAKANVDMDNLTSTGQNIANWSSNVTNCITEIPQDIKLELNAGVLTLKAGSKVYIPNGFESDNVTPKFDEVTIANDITFTETTYTYDYLCFVHSNNTTNKELPTQCYSGTTAPTGQTYMNWYDTSTNLVKRTSDGGSTWTSGYSLPICFIQTTAGVGITNIKHTFNGSGYIGSTVFALLDKGQIADGRNTDGTLKSTAVSQTSVAILEVQDVSRADVAIFIKSDHTLQAWGRDGGNVVSLATKPAVAPITFCRAYIEDENLWYHSYATTDWEARDGTDEIVEICAVTTDANRRITDFRPKYVFRADMNNSITGISQIMNLLYPVGAIYIGTQATCPLATLIPGSTWQQIQGRYLLASGTIAGTSETVTAGNTVAAGLPNVYATLQAARRGSNTTQTGCMWWGGTAAHKAGDSGGNVSWDDQLYLAANLSSSVYGQSTTVRPTAYAVNVWVRTA